MIALSAVQLCEQTFIHNAIMFIDTSKNAWYNQVHWLIRKPYFSIIASNDSILVGRWFKYSSMLDLGRNYLAFN